MDNSERFGRIEEVLADVLIEMHGMNARIDGLQQGQQQIIGIFNRFAGAVLTKMDEQTARMDAQTAKMDEQTVVLKGMREDIKLLYNHEERLRKIEALVFQKGA
jgi:energy-coupling factor transporter ATP-binding protein EcfA2